MSLTAFQRVRRMQQVEEMKPENIVKEEKIEEIPVPQPEEVKEEVKQEEVVEENPVEEPETEAVKEEVKVEEPEEKVEKSTNSGRGRRNQS